MRLHGGKRSKFHEGASLGIRDCRVPRGHSATAVFPRRRPLGFVAKPFRSRLMLGEYTIWCICVTQP